MRASPSVTARLDAPCDLARLDSAPSHLSTRDGTQDSSFGLQLVLKGMTSLGTAADRMLERGILGYSPNVY